MVQQYDVAENISQEVFVTVFKSISAFNENSSLSTWIYKITVNKCIDYQRSLTRQKNLGIFNFPTHNKSNEEINYIPTFEHPGVQLERKEKAKILFSLIYRLPENQKTAFILSQIEELPQKEIAVIMNISLKAVESLIQRAKASLRKKLEYLYEKKEI